MYDFLFFFQRDFYFIFLRSTIGLFQRDFDSKIMLFFYRSYFPCIHLNCTYFSKSIEKGQEFEYNFLMIYRYLNLVKYQRIIL